MANPQHKKINCTAPFCGDCWEVVKGNIQSVMKVAETLRGQAGVDPTRVEPKQ